ncbi:MAG TPA: amidohydrolase family protein [Longimicrobiaceae bacterium]|nr:amidohydrolase family protein [Longimicrobiaceae bacterium]
MARLREMHRSGVRMLAGTDVGALLMLPGYGLHDELAMLVEAVGTTPMEALQAATRNPAEYFGVQDSLGTVEPGRAADLVLLDADPLEDVRNTRAVRAVVANGVLLDRAALDRLAPVQGAPALRR